MSFYAYLYPTKIFAGKYVHDSKNKNIHVSWVLGEENITQSAPVLMTAQ